jgi:hypothetical protein
MRLIGILLLGMGLLLAKPVFAEWTEVGTTDDGESTFFIDRATVRKTANGRRAWTMRNHLKPTTEAGITFESAKALNEFNCALDAIRTLQLIHFSGQRGLGSVVSTVNHTGSWSVVSPESIGEVALKTVCKVPLK